MLREISKSEIDLVSGGNNLAVYSGGTWNYGNSCYSSAQAAAAAGAATFQVGSQFFGDAITIVKYTKEL